jgi:hypothetical protein
MSAPVAFTTNASAKLAKQSEASALVAAYVAKGGKITKNLPAKTRARRAKPTNKEGHCMSDVRNFEVQLPGSVAEAVVEVAETYKNGVGGYIAAAVLRQLLDDRAIELDALGGLLSKEAT